MKIITRFVEFIKRLGKKISEIARRFSETVKRLQKKKYIWIPATILFWLMPAFYLLEVESFHFYPTVLFNAFMPERISVIFFDLILFYLLFAIVFLLVKKAWICLVLFGGLMTAVSLTNYIKFALTGENFFPHDIIMTGNMNQLIGFVSVDFSWWAWVFFAAAVLSAVILGMFAKQAPFRFFIRIPAAIALSSLIVLFFSNAVTAEKIFNRFKMTYESASKQDSNYSENGFVGAFSINIAAFAIQKPEGYSLEELEAELDKYSDIPPSADFNSPDIIIVLSESFFDPRLLPDTLISPNPLENFDGLISRENARSGKLAVPTFGGGTIRTEFELLTGLSVDALPSGAIPYNIIRHEMNSYVSYYKNLGYDAIAMHPYLERFYSRNKTLPLIGFDAYYGIESLSQIYEVDQLIRESHDYVSDETFVEYLKYFLNEADKPLFLFGITMENHQPYRYKFDYREFTVSAYNEKLNERDQHNLEQYVQGIHYADKALGQLVEFIDNRERPTVLVYFGDHLPSISTGEDYSAFRDSGYFEGVSYSHESRKKLFTTPYVIYTNYDLNTDKKKEESKYEYIGTYDLLNVMSSMIGSGKTKYMGYLDALREILPYYNSRMAMRGMVTDEKREMLKIQYFATYREMKK